MKFPSYNGCFFSAFQILTTYLSVTYWSTKVKMAETILNVAAEEILGKLISITTDLIGLAWGFKEHIEEAMCYG